jgi:spore coat protein JB
MSDQNKLLKRIQALDFALYEVILYLDAYPTDKRALAYYQKCKRMAEELKAEYQCKHGPLTAFTNNDPNKWQWIDGPWPWEKEAN